MFYSGYLDRTAQKALLAEIEDVIARAPLYAPRMPRTGSPFSVRMTNCGSFGWMSDERGYRYTRTHPTSGEQWPPMPGILLDVWQNISGYCHPPEACLINCYGPAARMGMHQDRDEEDFNAPVVSLSLGDTCIFRLGGTSRRDPTVSFRLASGDVIVLAGEKRLAFHGVDRIIPGTSTLLPQGGRINLTLRRVTRSSATTD